MDQQPPPRKDRAIKVLLVIWIPETRDHVAKLLESDEKIEVVGSVETIDDAVEETRRLQPDVVIFDIDQPGGLMRGIPLTASMLEAGPVARVVIITVQGDVEYLRAAIKYGASDYLIKPFTAEEINTSVRRSVLAPRRMVEVPSPSPPAIPPAAVSPTPEPDELVGLLTDGGATGAADPGLRRTAHTARHPERPIKLLIALWTPDRGVLTAMLDRDPGIDVVGLPSYGAEAIIRDTQRLRPDVVLIDVDRAGGFPGGIQLVPTILDACPQTRVVIQSFGGEVHRGAALAYGASEYLSKPVWSAEVIRAIRSAAISERSQSQVMSEVEAFGRSWETAVGSTEPADHSTAAEAWAELYALADLPRPSVEWYPSPIAMDIAASGDPGDLLWRSAMQHVSGPLEVPRQAQELSLRPPHSPDNVPAIRSARAIARSIARARMGADMRARETERYVARGHFGERRSRPGEEATDGTLWTLGQALFGTEWDALTRWLGKASVVRVHRAGLLSGVKYMWTGLDWPNSAYHGQFDVLPPALEVARLAGLELAQPDEARLRCWLTIGRSCGAWSPFERAVRASERPIVLTLDASGRPHNEDGPAIAFGDGMVVHAWHGIAVPDWVIQQPERITVGQIDQEHDVEVRRVLTERFGAERFVSEGHAELVHEDETGRLWIRRPPRAPSTFEGRRVDDDAEPMVMVEVTNATAEPDGTRRTYFLRVPPDVRTARDAVAWTFSMAGSEYSPELET